MTDVPSGGSRTLLRSLIPYLSTTLLLGLVTAVLLRPALVHCGTTIVGAPGDATNGGVWTAYNYLVTGGPPWLETTPFTAAPTGEPWWRPYYITASFVFGPIWLLTRLSGSAVCGWNLTIGAGFVLSGLAMFALVRNLYRNDLVARLAALAYMISPYRQLKAEGHVAYVHTYLFPLLVLTSILLWQRPTRSRIVAASVVVALLGYTDGYFILLGGVAFVAVHGVALLWATRAERWPWAELRRRLVAILATGSIAGVLLLPVLATFLTTSSQISTALTRSSDEVTAYSARPHEFVVPARSHPVFDDLIGDWQDDNLHGSNYSESTLFLGWTVLVGAVVAIVGLVRRRSPGTSEALDRLTLVSLIGTAFAAFLWALPPRIDLGTVAVPTPAGILSSLVAFWRVYARFFIVLHVCLVALAAWSAAQLLRGRSRRMTATLAGLIVGLLAFENLVSLTPGSWSYDLAPEAYRYVASQREVDIIAEWPMLPTSTDPDHRYLTYLPVHGKRLVNVLEDQSPADQLARGIFGLNDPETADVLRHLGTDLVLVHRAAVPAEATPPADFEKVATFSYASDLERNQKLRREAARWSYLAPAYDVDVYRVKPGATAAAGIAVGRGFHGPEIAANGRSSRWMGSVGHLRVVPLAARDIRTATISLSMGSVENRRREVEIVQGGESVWSGVVTEPLTATFRVRIGQDIVVRAVPGAETVDDDPRRLAINVSQLDLLEVGP